MKLSSHISRATSGFTTTMYLVRYFFISSIALVFFLKMVELEVRTYSPASTIILSLFNVLDIMLDLGLSKNMYRFRDHFYFIDNFFFLNYNLSFCDNFAALIS